MLTTRSTTRCTVGRSMQSRTQSHSSLRARLVRVVVGGLGDHAQQRHQDARRRGAGHQRLRRAAPRAVTRCAPNALSYGPGATQPGRHMRGLHAACYMGYASSQPCRALRGQRQGAKVPRPAAKLQHSGHGSSLSQRLRRAAHIVQAIVERAPPQRGAPAWPPSQTGRPGPSRRTRPPPPAGSTRLPGCRRCPGRAFPRLSAPSTGPPSRSAALESCPR